MTHRRWWLLVLTLLAGAVLAGCSRGDKNKEQAAGTTAAPAATITPAPAATTTTAPVTATRTATSTTTATPAAQASAGCFQGLRTYRYSGTVKLKLPASLGSSAPSGDIVFDGTAVTPDRTQSKVQVGGQTFEVISIGNDIWTRQGSGAWEKNPADAGANFNFTPEDLCQFSPADLTKAGISGQAEKVNGLDTTHYQLTKQDFQRLNSSFGGPAGALATLFDRLDLGLWLTKEGWPVRLSLTAEQAASDGIAFSALFNVSDFNSTGITIEPPK